MYINSIQTLVYWIIDNHTGYRCAAAPTLEKAMRKQEVLAFESGSSRRFTIKAVII